MLGNGDGTFAPAPGSPILTPNLGGGPILVGDFLNHGKLDLLTGSYILEGNGDGTFTRRVLQGDWEGSPEVVGDFNGSGRLGFASAGNLLGQPATVVIQP
jgi:hypothetical protein